ncbi:MAG TPA: CAP domain-containing protein [Acidobacteriota bacterium]|nr:CAP domain-containing protein [Acidobacteriota bacterium]HQO20121.1 CAP domain-containing protein [Acidobacteriota bacterium]HQQ46990.1 CAP domain-containing protein [Acidobacteriota bacterium]
MRTDRIAAFPLLLCAAFLFQQAVPGQERPAFPASEIETKIHGLVNAERAKQGLKPFSWNESLAELARLHSEDMAKNDYFDYTDERGKNPSERAAEMNIACGKDFGGEIKVGLAENIYYADSYEEEKPKDGKQSYRTLTPDEIAASVVKGLMKPGGHRENILSRDYASEGIGVVLDRFGRVLVTQDFCLGEYAWPEPETRPEMSPEKLALMVHDYVNKERAKRRMQLLSWNDKLALAARLHSEDMAKKKYFAHKNLEGEDPTKRAYDIGFRCEKKSGSFVKIGVGENISQGNTAKSVTYIGERAYPDYEDMDEIARKTVEGWMNSPGHRDNILNLDYTSEGIGVAVSDNGEVYITEDFC